MSKIQDKNIVIFGGSSGIGLETAKMCRDLGANVIITGRNLERLTAVSATHGFKYLCFDVSNEDERNAVLANFNVEIDHLVLSLNGGCGAGTVDNIQPQGLRDGFEKKYFVYFHLIKDLIKKISEYGSITLVTGLPSRAIIPGTAGLSAINSAIEGMVKPLALELSPKRINAVAPGIIDTPWWDWLDATGKKRTFSAFASATPVERVGTPEDVASTILFLITNSFVTGNIIDVDGGLRLTGNLLGADYKYG